jgi:hypothetical protein
LFEEKRLFVRDAEGYLASAPNQLPPAQWINAREEISSQLAQGRDRRGDRSLAGFPAVDGALHLLTEFCRGEIQLFSQRAESFGRH